MHVGHAIHAVIDIVPLTAEQWRDLKRLRITALTESPDSFSPTAESARSHDDAYWQRGAKRAAEAENFEMFIVRRGGEGLDSRRRSATPRALATSARCGSIRVARSRCRWPLVRYGGRPSARARLRHDRVVGDRNERRGDRAVSVARIRADGRILSRCVRTRAAESVHALDALSFRTGRASR